MINSAVPLFRRQYLSEDTADSLTSEPVPAEGNEAVLSVTAINVDSAGSLSVSLEGSYDGLAWENLVTLASALTEFDYATATKSTLDVAWVRARATVTGTNGQALFDATVAFSEQ